MRFKKRYILCEIVYSDGRNIQRGLSRYDIYSCVKLAVQQAHGDYGAAVLQSSLQVKHWNVSTNVVIIRADRAFHKLLMSAMAFVKKIGKHDASFHTLHVSGTIRSCYKFLVKYHRQQLPNLLGMCQTQDEKDKICAIIQNLDWRESFGLPARDDGPPFRAQDNT